MPTIVIAMPARVSTRKMPMSQRRSVAMNCSETGLVISVSKEPSFTRADSWKKFIMYMPA